VRGIQRDARSIEKRIELLQIQIDRLHDPDQDKRKANLEKRVDALESDRAALLAEIPDTWESAHKDFRTLVDNEQNLRRKYRQAADNAYDPAQLILSSLNAFDDFKSLKSELEGMRQRIMDNEPEAMVDPLSDLASKFGDIEGASDIRSALSDARRALKSREPDKQKAVDEIGKAVKLYEEQLRWRTEADKSLRAGLQAYTDSLKSTIGIRFQPKLTRDQALFVAACTSDHRDVSLSF
jgi:DNA repair exonuclease SbcCD ATPase subunit